MKVSRDSILKRVSAFIGDRNDDDAIQFLEDLADSYESNINMNDYVSKADYENAIAERDTAIEAEKSMREKYVNRFYHESGEGEQREVTESVTESEGGNGEGVAAPSEDETTYEDLFEEKKEG